MSSIIHIAIWYLIPLLITRSLIRKLSIIVEKRPDIGELVINLIPVLNIVAIPVLSIEILQRKSNRTFAEVFYGLKNEDYWRKEDAE